MTVRSILLALVAVALALGCAHARRPLELSDDGDAGELSQPLAEPPPVPAAALADDPYAVLDGGGDGGEDLASKPNVSGVPPVAAPLPPDPLKAAAAKQEQLASEIEKALAADDLKTARKAARKWLLGCGPTGVDKCVDDGIARLHHLATLPPLDHPLGKLADQLAEGLACLAQAEKAPETPAPCLSKAVTAFVGFGDHLLTQRALLARAKAIPKTLAAAAPKAFKATLAACKEPRCAAGRVAAFSALAALAKERDRLDEELPYRFQRDRAAADMLPIERRVYARSNETDLACQRYDAAKGSGRCQALEKRLMKSLAFRDFSAEAMASGNDLSTDRILAVHAQYLALLSPCWRAEAKRMTDSNMEAFTLRWMIGANGRVARFDTDPSIDPNGPQAPLSRCLSAALAVFRYPKSTGENQHVEQTFTVSRSASAGP